MNFKNTYDQQLIYTKYKYLTLYRYRFLSMLLGIKGKIQSLLVYLATDWQVIFAFSWYAY